MPGSNDDQIINRITLKQAIRQLPPKQRAVIALRVSGYTQKECSLIIGLTRSAIGFIHKKTLRILRQEMGYVHS